MEICGHPCGDILKCHSAPLSFLFNVLQCQPSLWGISSPDLILFSSRLSAPRRQRDTDATLWIVAANRQHEGKQHSRTNVSTHALVSHGKALTPWQPGMQHVSLLQSVYGPSQGHFTARRSRSPPPLISLSIYLHTYSILIHVCAAVTGRTAGIPEWLY